jgi:hypothetical protein
MESTGIYWKPVFYLLEDAVTCPLLNATHSAQLTGRKTDVLDRVWRKGGKSGKPSVSRGVRTAGLLGPSVRFAHPRCSAGGS